MSLGEHVKESWECIGCDEDGMTAREFRSHTINEHSDIGTISDIFPEYHVCTCGVATDVYMKASSEDGPYYIAWEGRDYIDEMHPYELLRHDWERIEREDTPFPEFEGF